MKVVGVASEVEIGTTCVHYFCNFVFIKSVLSAASRLSSRRIIRRSTHRKISLYFYVTVALLLVIQQLLKWLLKTVAVVLQRTFQQRKVGYHWKLLFVTQEVVYESILNMRDQKETAYKKPSLRKLRTTHELSLHHPFSLKWNSSVNCGLKFLTCRVFPGLCSTQWRWRSWFYTLLSLILCSKPPQRFLMLFIKRLGAVAIQQLQMKN